jgi:hypothetical protein
MHIQPPTPTAPVRRARRGAIVAVTGLACAALIGACGSSASTTSTATNLETKRVAASIEQSVLSERHLHVTVECPITEPQQAGTTFSCIATGHNAKGVATRTPFKVTVQNSKGYVTYVGE